MNYKKSRWILFNRSTNDHGVTFFSLACKDGFESNDDYGELEAILKKEFGAVEAGELVGPYSVHKYLRVAGVTVGIILDSPDWLDLYVKNSSDLPALETLVNQVLAKLNDTKPQNNNQK